MRLKAGLIGLFGLSLVACSDSDAPERSHEEMAQIGARAASLRPEDARLAEVYVRSCANCHGVAASGAPLTGDATGWSSRLAKGEDALLENTITGFQGMPPMGLCPDCSATEFRALISFMATDPELAQNR